MNDDPAMRTGLRGSPAERFEALYAAHQAQVFGYVLRRCARPEDAADVIAETFLVVWRRLDELPDGDEVRPWLYGVARRVLSNQRRGAQRRSALAERLEAELATRPIPLSVSHESPDETDVRLRAALAGLSEEDREILMLESWEELRPAELARVLGCSAGAARTRLHRARERLRDRLEATYERAALARAEGSTRLEGRSNG
jgi:RNA polymerase sigma-70 factor (ECF subfamily)